MPVSPFMNIIGQVGSLIESALTWAVDVSELLVSKPILLLMVVCIPAVGLGIGLFKRLCNAG